MILNINNRLKRVADFVENRRLADIGSDHAYLPIYLAKEGKIDFAVAGEVVEGPHKSSVQNVKDNNLVDTIVCRKASGLDAISLDDNIDVITICGMGGKLIADILESGKEKLANKPQLVLQPNVAANLLRSKLKELGYKIVAEDIMEEDGHIYEIIVANPGQMTMNEEEVFFGKYLLESKNEAFVAKYEQELEKISYIKAQLEKSKTDSKEKLEELNKQEEMINKVLEK
ncbi:MAG: tRNA (adenine(22)-N(1))-methyltransferase TrmK [Gemella sp.]|nr:tRNA (adenine(22)-N(1))-methyltransferase TrmK [Gemella sp.]